MANVHRPQTTAPIKTSSTRASRPSATAGLFILVSVLWGLPYALIATSLKDLPPATLTAARVVVGAAVLVPFAARSGVAILLLRQRWAQLATVSAVEIAIPYSLIARAEVSVPSATTGVLVALAPAFVVVLSGQARPTRWPLVLGIGVGFLGVVVLLGPTTINPAAGLVIAATFGYALGGILIDRWFAGEPRTTVCCLMLALALPPLVVAAALDPAGRHWTPTATFATVLLGVACTAGGLLAFMALVTRSGATVTSTITYTAPLVAAAAGWVLHDEDLGVCSAAGTVLIFTGAALARPLRGIKATQPGHISQPDL